MKTIYLLSGRLKKPSIKPLQTFCVMAYFWLRAYNHMRFLRRVFNKCFKINFGNQNFFPSFFPMFDNQSRSKTICKISNLFLILLFLFFFLFCKHPQIVNMEWGGFDSHAVAGAATVYDYAIDREEDPTSQRFEKQIRKN